MIPFHIESPRRGLKIGMESFRHHTWGAIAGAAVSVVGGAIASNQSRKRAPGVAEYTPVDLQQEQTDAIRGNLDSQGSIEALLSRANQFQQGQALSLTEQAMPGYTNLAKRLTDTTTSLLDNPYDVPKDVEENLARIAAERGISGGTRGQFNDFSLLRDFGINSLQYGRDRINQASSITNLLSSIAPKVNPMSPLAFYVTPQQNAATTTENNQTQQGIRQGANNAQAAATNANNATWANLINSASGLASSYLNNRAANDYAVDGAGGRQR